MKIIFLFLLLLSCGPLVEVKRGKCPSKEEILLSYSAKRTPKEFRVYGRVSFGPLKFPILLAKFDGIYTVKVPGKERVFVDGKVVCVRERCYLLPLPPENFIFGGVLLGRERVLCSGNRLVFKDTGKIYEREILFEGGRLSEYRVRNRRSGKTLKVFFGPKERGGYFRYIILESGGRRLKISVEGVDI